VKDLSEAVKARDNKIQKLTEDKNKFKEALTTLRDKVDGVNTVNAKLLYINKALESDSLNERQKRTIVEAISKAEDAKEAKVIYETLQSTVGSTERNSMPKSLSEAVNRRPSLLVQQAKKQENKQNGALAERMKRLAGLT